MKLEYLNKLIASLNKDNEIDGEVIKSQFKFEYEVVDGVLRIYDANENYHIDYEYEMNETLYECAKEFGVKFKRYTDDIKPRFEQAVVDDGVNSDGIVEWENNVVMVCRIES